MQNFQGRLRLLNTGNRTTTVARCFYTLFLCCSRHRWLQADICGLVVRCCTRRNPVRLLGTNNCALLNLPYGASVRHCTDTFRSRCARLVSTSIRHTAGWYCAENPAGLFRKSLAFVIQQVKQPCILQILDIIHDRCP